jgi:hypothetical protein
VAAGILAGIVAATAHAGEVKGKYVGNGKEAKLAFAVVVPHDPWQDEPAYTLVLSEKDPGKSTSASTEALFGKLGDALTISFTKSGKVIGTQVCHQSLKKAGFSSIGVMEVEGFKLDGGSVSARFFTKAEQEFFGDRWSVDLSAKAALPAK